MVNQAENQLCNLTTLQNRISNAQPLRCTLSCQERITPMSPCYPSVTQAVVGGDSNEGTNKDTGSIS